MEKNKIEIESVSSPIFPPLRRRDIPRKESVVPFPKGIRGIDINRLSQDIRDVSWRGLVCDRWEDRFRIPLLVSVISTLTRTAWNQWYRESVYTYIHTQEGRIKEKERLARRKVAHDRSGTDLWIRFGTPRIRPTVYTTMWNVETIW